MAETLRKQIGIFYRIFPLNRYSKDDLEFKKVLVKPIGLGKAKSIDKKDFSKSRSQKTQRALEHLDNYNPELTEALKRDDVSDLAIYINILFLYKIFFFFYYFFYCCNKL